MKLVRETPLPDPSVRYAAVTFVCLFVGSVSFVSAVAGVLHLIFR